MAKNSSELGFTPDRWTRPKPRHGVRVFLGKRPDTSFGRPWKGQVHKHQFGSWASQAVFEIISEFPAIFAPLPTKVLFPKCTQLNRLIGNERLKSP
jgi:hypothetical protein